MPSFGVPGFCWCGMFLSAVITTSYPASSARSSNAPLPSAAHRRAPPPRRCHDRRGDVETAGAYCGETGFACETMATLASRSCTTNSKTVRTCASSPSNHSTKSWTVAPSARLPKKGGHGQPGAGKHPGSANPAGHAFHRWAPTPVRHAVTSLSMPAPLPVVD